MADIKTLRPISEPLVVGAVRAFDAIAVMLVGAAGYGLYLEGESYAVPEYYAGFMVALLLLQQNFFGLFRVYATLFDPSRFALLRRIFLAWTTALVTIVAAAFLAKVSEEFSRAWVGIVYGGGLFAMLLVRTGLAAVIRRWHRDGRLRTVLALVGGGESARRFIKRLKQRNDDAYTVIGVFDDRAARTPADIDGCPYLGTVDDLIVYCRTHRVDQVVLTLPWSAENRILETLERVMALPVRVRLGPDLVGFHFGRANVTHLGDVPVLHLAEPALSDWSHFVKSVEDKILAAAVVFFIAPLMICIALAIKLDSPGPVFFRQRRYGFNNRIFIAYKFRTMHVHMSDESARALTAPGDVRVTRVGAFLRRTSLDEVPQFLNVLKGDMSVVGPRPHALGAKAGAKLYHDVFAKYAHRHRVKPGITGWAQINGWRGATDTVEQLEKRVEADLYYIENWSIWLDLRIILATPIAILRGENAY